MSWERREVGGAGSQSNLGTRLGLGFNGLTVAGTPKVSTVPPRQGRVYSVDPDCGIR